jgi:hypothetical protein
MTAGSALEAKGAATSPDFTAALFLAVNNPNYRIWFNWLVLIFPRSKARLGKYFTFLCRFMSQRVLSMCFSSPTAMGAIFFLDKGTRPLCWAGTPPASVEVTVSGVHNHLNYSVLLDFKLSPCSKCCVLSFG